MTFSLHPQMNVGYISCHLSFYISITISHTSIPYQDLKNAIWRCSTQKGTDPEDNNAENVWKYDIKYWRVGNLVWSRRNWEVLCNYVITNFEVAKEPTRTYLRFCDCLIVFLFFWGFLSLTVTAIDLTAGLKCRVTPKVRTTAWRHIHRTYTLS